MSTHEPRRGGRIPRPIEERFAGRYLVEDRGYETPCWIWTSSISTSGYGRISTGFRTGRRVQAHRFAYEHFVGPIPAGYEIDHLCRNRPCVNPAHLEPVTRRENLLRGETIVARAVAKTHCKRGHPFDEGNTIIAKNGTRHCRACHREHDRRAYHEKKAQTS